MNEERKYEVLPGVELPDMKSINEAASDFSVSGVKDIQIKTPTPVFTSEGTPADVATAAELAALQSLGDQVAADEARAAAESRKRMDQILSTAVQAPESIIDLLNYNKDKISEEVIKQKEEELKKEQELKKAEEERERAREERRQMQQRLLQEARDRAAMLREAEKRGIKPDEALTETAPKAEEPAKEAEKVVEAEPEKPVEKPVEKEPVKEPEKVVERAPAKPLERKPEEPFKSAIASAEETFDDFTEFLDDNK